MRKLRDGIAKITVIGPPAQTLTYERDRGKVRNRRIDGRRASPQRFAVALARAKVKAA